MLYRIEKITTEKFKLINKTNSDMHEYVLNPSFGKTIVKVSNDVYELHLFFRIQDNEKEKTPYDIDFEIKSIFSFKDAKENEIDTFMNENAILITFPYLRSILSTTMTAMMLDPIVLPIIDPNVLMNKK